MGNPNLSAPTVRQLAFVRLIYARGVLQADEPDPMFALAVNDFQDSVEAFLRLASNVLKVNLPSHLNFLDYWDKIEPELPGQTGHLKLPAKNAMDRMNKLRVNFKHYGLEPSRANVEQARADVLTFFTDATPLVFGVDFAAVDLIDLVPRKETKDQLMAAQTYADVGNYVKAGAGLAIAFQDMLDHYAQRAYSYRNPFAFGSKIQDAFVRYEQELGRDLGRVVRDIVEFVGPAQQALRMLALRIDYRRYIEFTMLTPRISRSVGGTIRYSYGDALNALTEQDYQKCRLFVIESTLEAAKTEAAIEAWERSKSGPGVGGHADEWDGPRVEAE
jgi:hypothetical protein